MDQAKSRFLSLDVLRGLTICFMIIVNSPGSGAIPFTPLLHANWHGFTPTDLVFPTFLFVVGNAMSFTAKKQVSLPATEVMGKIAKRTVILFLLGYLMYWFPFFKLGEHREILNFPISQTRIFGVLQRIALCYGIASILVYYLKFSKVLIVSIILLISYNLLLFITGVPNQQFTLHGNTGFFFDSWLVGEDHIYHDHGVIFDPEGLLSTFPAIVNVLVGYYAGLFLQQTGNGYETISKLLLTGCLFVFVALCWNLFFPINKKLWTSSFVLLTTGLDLIIISALIYSIEMKQWFKSNLLNFFVIPGKNPLFIYLVSELLLVSLMMISVSPGASVFDWVSISVFQYLIPGPLGSLAFAVCYMLLCWSFAFMLDQKKIYIRI